MYQPRPSPRDRAATIALVAAIHAGLGLALLGLSGPVRDKMPEDVIELFEVIDPPLSVVEKLAEADAAKPKRDEGAASAKNIESKATVVVAPKPRIPLPVPQPVPVTQTPGQGSEATQGASDIVGPGTGAGGQGTGTGSGGSGGGSGGGGIGGGTGVRLVRGITGRDYPNAIQRGWPRGGRIYVRVRIEPDGRISRCDVMRGFGSSSADQWTCSLILSRAQFRPATDADGRPVAAWFGYVQADTGRREPR